MAREPKTRVVVVGGGYAGVKALAELSRYRDLEVTLLDRSRLHYLQPETHEFIAGKTLIEEVALDLQKFANRFHESIRFLAREVIRFDYANQTLHLSDDTTLTYDYLIVAVGSRTFFPSQIAGIDQHTVDIKTLAGALKFRQHFEMMLAKQMSHENSDPYRIIVGGAGLSGVEIIAEMAHRARALGVGPEKMQFTIVEPLETVLPGMDPYLIKATNDRFDELGIERIHGHFIKEVQNGVITLGEMTLPFDMFIFAAGIVAEEVRDDQGLSRNRRGQFEVDRYLRMEGVENVFFAGDVAQLVDRKGNYLAPTSQIAKQSARCAVENVARSVGHVRLLPCASKIKGVLVALGGEHAAGMLFGTFRFKGRFGYLIKKLVFLIHALQMRRYF